MLARSIAAALAILILSGTAFAADTTAAYVRNTAATPAANAPPCKECISNLR